MPTVIGNKVVSPRQALLAYMKSGKNLGTFKNATAADRYAQLLHLQQAAYYGLG